MIALFFSALLLGLAGSVHCAGMCGPIALSLPLYGHTVLQKISGALIYNAGRIITYGLLGFIFGLIGEGFHLIGFQQAVSIIMGAGMIILSLFPKFFRSYYNAASHTFGWTGQLKTLFRRLFSVRSFRSLFFIGLLNGLLPCGLVYIAVAGSLATGSRALGTSYMILFGLGTVPMLIFIATMGNVISISLRHKINKLIPILVIIVGIFFILRGLNLGIPMLSPSKEKIEKKFEKSLEEKGISENQTYSEYYRNFNFDVPKFSTFV
jgi:uncharacterized protein